MAEIALFGREFCVHLSLLQLECMKRFHALFRFLVSGGLAAAVNIGTLYVLTEYAHIHYLQSAVLSFSAAFFVGFFLQKFWTFKDTRKEAIRWQMIMYLGLALINLLVNTLLIYVLVEYMHLWYVGAAVTSTALLAVNNFFIYKHVIFTKKEESPTL